MNSLINLKRGIKTPLIFIPPRKPLKLYKCSKITNSILSITKKILHKTTMYNFLLWKESKIFIRLKKDKNLIYDKKITNKY